MVDMPAGRGVEVPGRPRPTAADIEALARMIAADAQQAQKVRRGFLLDALQDEKIHRILDAYLDALDPGE